MAKQEYRNIKSCPLSCLPLSARVAQLSSFSAIGGAAISICALFSTLLIVNIGLNHDQKLTSPPVAVAQGQKGFVAVCALVDRCARTVYLQSIPAHNMSPEDRTPCVTLLLFPLDSLISAIETIEAESGCLPMSSALMQATADNTLRDEFFTATRFYHPCVDSATHQSKASE